MHTSIMDPGFANSDIFMSCDLAAKLGSTFNHEHVFHVVDDS